MLLLVYIVLGCVVFSLAHGWSILDSLFFCFAILTTIGLLEIPLEGERNRLTPKDEVSGPFVLMCTAYLLNGLTLVSMCFNLLFAGNSSGSNWPFASTDDRFRLLRQTEGPS